MFSGSKARDHIHPTSSLVPSEPRDPEGRLIHFVWTPEEDALLRSVLHQLGPNWALVGDVFNNSRITIPTDRRSPWDCYQRWLAIRGESAEDAAAWGLPTPGASGSAGGARGSIPMTPQQHLQQQRLQAQVAANPAANRKVSSQIASARAAGGRRNMRHAILFEVMKKSAGKRAAKIPRKSEFQFIPDCTGSANRSTSFGNL